MMRSRWGVCAAATVAACALGLLGCKRKKPPPAPSPRPVRVVALTASNPTEKLQLTGVLEAWSAQDVAFEVPGRVDYIVEEGTHLKGRWVEGDTVIEKGEVLATIDRATYLAALQAAEAQVKHAQVNLSSLLPAQLAVAKAGRDYAEFSFERTTIVHAKKVATDVELNEERAKRDIARAKVDEAKAGIEAGKTSLAQAEASLVQAKLDLQNTTLPAPFTGQVAKLYVRAGGYVRAGQAVAHVVTTDPVKVNVTVSGATNRTIAVGDRVDVYLPDRSKPLMGAVYQKAAVADPGTRTFNVTLITRNERAPVTPPSDSEALKLPRIGRIAPLLQADTGKPDRLYVAEKQCLRRDQEGHFVWALEGLSVHDRIDPAQAIFTVRKARVVPGEHRVNLQGIYILRELKDTGGLKLGQAVASEPPEGLKDGDRVAHIPEDWLLQPDGIVRVQFKRDKGQAGYYVPLPAIVPVAEGEGYVFVVAASGAEAKARKVTVALHESIGALQRIESEALQDGMPVIVEGTHYVKDGERVQVLSEKAE